MPWNSREFREKFNKRLSARQAMTAAKTANAVLKKTGDEGLAVRVANKQVKGRAKKK